MRQERTEVLVIGGGATGTGVLRDLAMRGFDALLVEQRDLSHGTTGRYHGLLHSGGRYVVKDPEAAVECIEENMVLRRIMPHCIEDTSGFFVTTPEDDLDYLPRFIEGCAKTGIPCSEIPVAEALRREPYLNPDISHCLEVPDAAADSFLATISTAASAREHGARVLPYHQVETLVRSGDRVVGARCRDLVAGEEVEIGAELVVNASGAWAGRIAATAGINFQVLAGKGTMIAVNHRMINTVLNRCKMPSDGDIIVPIRTVAVIGTTDEGVPDPERFSVEPWEVRHMLEEGEKLVPGISGMRVLRAWAGVRPLYQPDAVTDTRDVTRAYALLDHSSRDQVEGILTITGGKWTTFRQMAQVTVDQVCRKLGTERTCTTHLEPVPDPRRRHRFHWLGERLSDVEENEQYGDLVCECELTTRAEVTRAIVDEDAKTIDDIRRQIRLGMGPCQGTWCLPRVAGILHDLRQPQVLETNAALRDFVEERWKGLVPIMWGLQLQQAALTDLVLNSLLNVPDLSGPPGSPLGPVMYTDPSDQTTVTTSPLRPATPSATVASLDRDVIVIGGGLAGLTAAWYAARAGAATTLLTKGWGSLLWHAGSIDVLGYLPPQPEPVDNPEMALTDLVARRPEHPYALAGLDSLRQALADVVELCQAAGYPLEGGLDSNFLIPTAVGAARPSCLVPATMAPGDLRRSEPILVVGFDRYPDLSPRFTADNLTARGVPATGVSLNLPTLVSRRFVNATVLAGLFQERWFRDEVLEALKGHDIPARVGFPAVLGLDYATEVVADLSSRLGAAVFEIPTLPPSVPGMRLQRIIRNATEEKGGWLVDGAEVVEVSAANGALTVASAAAARRRLHRAQAVVLATGGILGGGLVGASDGNLSEVVAGLEVDGPKNRRDWFRTDQGWGRPVLRSGVVATEGMRPARDKGLPRLLIAGTLLAGGDPAGERSREGIALATGATAGKAARAMVGIA